MRINWTTFIALALALLYCHAPLQAGSEGPTQDMNQAEVLRKIEKTLDVMSKNIEKSFKNVGAEIKQLKENNIDLNFQLLNAQKRIEALEKTVGQLQLTLKLGPDGPPGVDPDKGDGGNKNPFPPEGTKLSERVTTLELQLEMLRKDVTELKQKSTSTSFYPSEKSLDEIKLRLDQMDKNLSALKTNGTRVALSPSTTGRLALVNRSAEEILFVVNGVPHRVGPAATKIVRGHPPGTITYEVFSPSLGNSVPRVTSLPANYTLTLTAD